MSDEVGAPPANEDTKPEVETEPLTVRVRDQVSERASLLAALVVVVLGVVVAGHRCFFRAVVNAEYPTWVWFDSIQ